MDNILSNGYSFGMDIAQRLAGNIASIRKRRNLSQHQLAKLAGVPRSTLSHIESGEGNPSLSNLSRLSQALQVSVEELLSPPERSVRSIRKSDVPIVRKSGGNVEIFKLMPFRIKGIEIERMEFKKDALMGGTPHVAGTREFLTTIQGAIEVSVEGERYVVKEGDVLAFRGDQPHSYRNTVGRASVAISVVIPIPPGAAE